MKYVIKVNANRGRFFLVLIAACHQFRVRVRVGVRVRNRVSELFIKFKHSYPEGNVQEGTCPTPGAMKGGGTSTVPKPVSRGLSSVIIRVMLRCRLTCHNCTKMHVFRREFASFFAALFPNPRGCMNTSMTRCVSCSDVVNNH